MSDPSDAPSRSEWPEAERVRKAAASVNAAHRRIGATASELGRSEAAHAAWEDSTIAFHRAMASMYPSDFLEAVRTSKTGDPVAVERVVTFLEVDPWCFRSGYMKEEILHRLKSAPIDERQQGRLREIVLAAIDGGDRREFRSYCRLARRLVDDGFRAELLVRLRWSNLGIARRALWVLDAIGEPLGRDDRVIAQRILETEAEKSAHWWRVARWVEVLAGRCGDEAWAGRLVERAVAQGAGSAAALRLLPALDAALSDVDRDVLGQHLLAIVEQGGDESYLESTAVLLDSPRLRERLLAAYLGAPDAEVERRAWWAINAIRRHGRGGWPEVDHRA